MRSHQYGSYKAQTSWPGSSGRSAIPGVCPVSHLVSSGAWLRALCLQGLLGRMSLGLKNPKGFDSDALGIRESLERLEGFEVDHHLIRHTAKTYQNAMRTVHDFGVIGGSTVVEGLHCSHSLHCFGSRSIKVGLRWGPQWKLFFTWVFPLQKRVGTSFFLLT